AAGAYRYDGVDSAVNHCGGFESSGVAQAIPLPERPDGHAHGGATHGAGDAADSSRLAALAARGAAEPMRAVSPASTRARTGYVELLAD
nr:hypothetical protein [Tanacetum cinerariifolium]